MSRPFSSTLPPESWTPITTVLGMEQLPGSSGIQIKGKEASVSLQLFNEGTVRLRMHRPHGESLPPGILDTTTFSPVDLDIQPTGSGWQATHGNMAIVVERNLLQITVLQDNKTIWSTTGGGIGFRHDSVWCRIPLQQDTHLYGLGEKVGGLNKRTGRWTQWTTDRFLHTPNADPLYVAIPFAILYDGISSVGIFFANAHRSYFDADISQPNMLTLGADGGDLDLFIFPGPIDRILKRYTALTGRMPLPPLYALGFQQSRYSYETEDEVRTVARNFRENQVPCDILYLDIDYMQGYRVFTWDPTRFPEPSRLLSDLKNDGFGVVPIIDPGVKVDSHYPVYLEGRREGHFLTYTNGEEFQSQVWPGMCAFPDFLQPQTRQWWGQQHRTLIDQGVAGIWNDMNEPAWNRGGSGHYGHDNDADIEHRDGITSYSHSAVHNLYALCEAQATFEGLRDASQVTTAEGRATHLRPFILSRSGFSGIQRYAAVWTGDNCSWWDHLALSIPMCLNLGLSGVAFCGPDAGGFQHNATPELYARWIQMGVFFPFLRAHSAKNTHRHEPWSFGSDVLAIARQYIEYRYRLLPYWYSLFYLASETGIPPMRPLVWEFGEHRETWDIDDQFLVGSGLMVAPIIRPSTYERRVYVPPGHWFDIWNQEEIVGPSSLLVAAPLNRLPLFLKSGSIIPLGPRILSIAQQIPQDLAQGTDGPREFFIVRGKGQFLVYSDDGKTDQYQYGAYRTITVKVVSNGAVTRVSWETEHWPSEAGMLRGSYLVHVGYYNQAPQRMFSDNRPLLQVKNNPNLGQWTWHEVEHRISVVLPSTPTPDHRVDLVIEE